MIDLHSHILPGLDDGSPDLSTSLEMARIAVADGTTHLACTPHITPGVYDTTLAAIRSGFGELSAALREARIELTLVGGADVYIDPLLPEKLQKGLVPTLNGSRYLLFEPPHNVAPPRLADAVRSLVEVGYVPILTHPERLRWIESHYELVLGMIKQGAAVQLTAASITGGFGRRAKYWSERMLDERLVDIIASDAHNTHSRPPLMSLARDAIAERLGEAEAQMMVLGRPAAILNNEPLPARQQQVVPQMPVKRRSALRHWVQKLGIGGR